jgi:hypothetical protein
MDVSRSGLIKKVGKHTGRHKARLVRVDATGGGDGCINFFANINPGPAEKPRRVQPISSVDSVKLVCVKFITSYDEFLVKVGSPMAAVNMAGSRGLMGCICRPRRRTRLPSSG